MKIEIDWKEVCGKALMGAIYAAVADITLTQNITQDTLMYAAILAGLRALMSIIQSVKEEVEKSTAGPRKLKSYLSRIV